MIRNSFKERQERKVQKLIRRAQELKRDIAHSKQSDKLQQKMLKLLEDEQWYDTTYVIYSSEFPNLSYTDISRFVSWVCAEGNFSYEERLYLDDGSFVFYIYVRKREEPKCNVGDVVHCRVGPYRIEADVTVLGRRYNGRGRYKYLIPSEEGMKWEYLDNIEKVEKDG